MSTRSSDRLFAALGIGFIVLELAGVLLSNDLHGGSLSDSTAAYAAAIAHPIAAHNWVGAYLEMLSVGCFLAFAVWAADRLGGGVLGQLARGTAAAYTAVTVASLGVMDAIGYREGHGLSVAAARSLDAINKGTYVGTWFLGAFFLLALGALAVGAGRRRLGWSGVAVGVVTLAAAPSIDNFGEMTVFLFFVWIVAASITLARGKATPASALAAQHA